MKDYYNNGELLGKEITIEERNEMLTHSEFFYVDRFYFKGEDNKFYLQEIYSDNTNTLYSLIIPAIKE